MSASIRVILLFLTLAGCSTGPDQFSFQGNTMGTTWSAKLVSSERFDQSQMQDGIQAVLDDINAKMSNWDKNSEVSIFNNSPAGCYPVSADTLKVVQVSQELSRLSGGIFDATVGPLIQLWGFGSDFTADQIPDAEQITALLTRVGYQKMHVQDATLCKDTDDLFINLSATAKGYGVDKVAEYLESKGVERYMVEVGGEIRALGLNHNNQKWRIGIEIPTDTAIPVLSSDQIQDLVEMDHGGLATSGDYRNFFMHEGVRYSHVIDPRNGYPIPQQLASVTVVQDNTLWADGWATTLLALGPDAGLALAEQENIATYLVLRTEAGFEVKISSAWRQNHAN